MTFINTYLFQTAAASKSPVVNPGFQHDPCDRPICSHLNWIAVKLTILFVGNCTELIRTMTFSFHFNSFYCGLCFQENFASYNIRLQPTFRNCFISTCIHDMTVFEEYTKTIFPDPFWIYEIISVNKTFIRISEFGLPSNVLFYQLHCRTMLNRSKIHRLSLFCITLNCGRYLLISKSLRWPKSW